MNPVDAFFATISSLGTVASNLHGVEKNGVDDVILEIMRKTSASHKIDSKEIKKTLDGLMANKIHILGYKNVKTRHMVK